MSKTVVVCTFYENFRLFDCETKNITEDFLLPWQDLKQELNRTGYVLKYAQDLNSEQLLSAHAVLFFDIPFSLYRKWIKPSAFARSGLAIVKNYLKIKKDCFLQMKSQVKQSKKILVMAESKAVTPENYLERNHDYFDKILTFVDDFIKNEKYILQRIPVGYLENYNISSLSFEQKKFAVMINAKKESRIKGELYSERIKIANFFASINTDLLDIYGGLWGTHPCAQGKIDDKIQTLSKYKFCICYENFKDCKGYVTEKMFDCFKAKVVPVYLGAPNICDIVPDNCFIDRRKFNSNQELFDFLKSVREDDHKKYLDNAELFFQSDAFKKFTSSTLVQNVLKALET